MIYLDYAATSLKRVELIEYIMNNMMDFDANADSIHTVSYTHLTLPTKA